MSVGRVIRFDEVHGFGFIQCDEAEEDVFMHVNDLQFPKQLLSTGSEVEFDLERTNRGFKAMSIRMPGTEPLPQSSRRDAQDEGFVDVLPRREFNTEITEILLQRCPTLTATQIVEVRAQIMSVATRYGWVEDK